MLDGDVEMMCVETEPIREGEGRLRQDADERPSVLMRS